MIKVLNSNRGGKTSFIAVTTAIALGLYLSRLHSYLLFHSLIEITTMAIGFTLFIFIWNARKFLLQDKLPFCILFGILVSVLTLSNSFAEASNDPKLLFLGNKNIAPVVYLDNTTPSGVAVDIVRALAKHIPQPVEIRAMDWSEAQALVARGKADALIQINETEERKKIYDFSDTLLESQFSIFVRTDRVGISGITSLRGLQVGVESGGLPRQLLGKNPRIQLTIIPNFPEGFKLLKEGTIDAVVVDYRVGSYIIAENKLRNIKVTGDPIAFSYSSIAVKKGNTKLLNAINNALQIIKADGTYQHIIDKWEPEEVVFQTRAQITHMVYYVTIVTLLILILIAVIWMVTLRKELVRRKAAEEMLREQYSTLHSIINSSNALIFSVDRQYRYTSFNKGHAAVMQALYGAEIETGHSLLDYMTVPEDREVSKRNFDRALAGEQLVEEAYSGEELRPRQYFQVSHSPIKREEEIIGVAVIAHDMTERKRVEDLLQINVERYLKAQTMGHVGNWEYNLQTNHFWGSKEAKRIYGFDLEQADFSTDEVENCIPERERVHQALVDLIEKGKAYNLEFEIHPRNSSEPRIIASIAELQRDEHGEPLKVVGVIQDITERKRVEEALHKLNRELRAISNCNQVLVRAEDEQVLLNDICRIICDEAGYRLAWVGYAEQDDAKTVRPVAWGGFNSGYVANANLSWSDDTDRGRGPGGTCIRTGEIVYIQNFITDPQMAPWREDALQRGYRSTIALPLKDENANVFGVLLIYSAEINAFTQAEIRLLEELANDLAFGIMVLRGRIEHKRAEEDLEESEAKTRSILDNIGIGVSLISPKMEILELNHRMREWFPAVDPAQHPICYRAFNDPPREIMCDYCPTFRTLQDGLVHEATTQTPQAGAVRNYRVVSSPVLNAAGAVTAAIEMVEDITDKLSLESQLRQAQKMEAIGTLAGGIAHDFNNILSAIIGYGHVTLMKMPKDDPLRINIERMLESANRAAVLTQSLLAFSRKQISERKPVDLNSILKKVEKFLIRVIGEDVVISMVQAEGALTVFADAGQLEQVFMNLATNARDAMPNGGSLMIETSIIKLDSRFVAAHGYGKPGTYAMISATDTGVGMNEETRGKIFEPFFTTKEVGKGTGLGLAMVYGIIKQHEGFINVYSELGKGTTFRIYLPMIKSEAADEKSVVIAEYSKGGTETILLAEDDEDLRNLTVIVLEQRGYRVITAKDGSEAVEKYRENQDSIQLLLFDLIMPNKNGREACNEIRKIRPDIPVIFESGYSPDLLQQKALLEKDALLISKPITPTILLQKVRSMLDGER